MLSILKTAFKFVFVLWICPKVHFPHQIIIHTNNQFKAQKLCFPIEFWMRSNWNWSNDIMVSATHNSRNKQKINMIYRKNITYIIEIRTKKNISFNGGTDKDDVLATLGFISFSTIFIFTIEQKQTLYFIYLNM